MHFIARDTRLNGWMSHTSEVYIKCKTSGLGAVFSPEFQSQYLFHDVPTQLPFLQAWQMLRLTTDAYTGVGQDNLRNPLGGLLITCLSVEQTAHCGSHLQASQTSF